MTPSEREQPTGRCPVCGGAAEQSLRYPRALCSPCVARATDLAGRPVLLQNTSIGGGFAAVYRDDRSPCQQVSDDGRVLVDGVEHLASEHYFGGIVVRPLPPRS